jgi:hypothetical protein
MKRTLAILILVILASTATAQTDEFPEGYDPSQPYLDPVEGAEAYVTNRLVVDAATGLATFTNNGGNSTDVIVTGLTPRVSGFDLHDSLGNPKVLNATSTSAGEAKFLHAGIKRDIYVVTRTVSGLKTVVTTFSTKDFNIPLNGQSMEGAPPDPCAAGVIYSEYNATRILWTPLVIAHAPYYGEGTASSSRSVS